MLAIGVTPTLYEGMLHAGHRRDPDPDPTLGHAAR